MGCRGLVSQVADLRFSPHRSLSCLGALAGSGVTEQFAQNTSLKRRNLRRAALARTCQMNAPIKDDGSILNHENAVGEVTASATTCVAMIAVNRWSIQTRSISRCIEMRVSASSAPSGSSKASPPGDQSEARRVAFGRRTTPPLKQARGAVGELAQQRMDEDAQDRDVHQQELTACIAI
jgi:hypothetical protein